MKLIFTEEQDAFRHEVRKFLKDELISKNHKAQSKCLVLDWDNDFSKKMSARKWIGLTWPKEIWGQGRSHIEKTILNEELYRVQAPIGYHFVADSWVGPALIHFGTDRQKERFLPRIADADDGMMFCLLFSERDAGSDLTAVSTTAFRDGDHYVINGRKFMSTQAHMADFGWLLAKTNFDPDVSPHDACSEFILDMRLPGIELRPIVNMAGEHSFNEVTLKDVRVHKDCLVGRENSGFRQTMAQIDYERSGIERLMQNYPVYDQLLDKVKLIQIQHRNQELYEWAKDQLAQLEVEFQTGRMLCYYTAWTIDKGRRPTSQAAMCKAYCTQYEQRLNDVAMKILGPRSLIVNGGPWAALDMDVASCYLWQPSYTLQGGSVEILKNILAQRGLNLSKDC